jgi:hypothetical protein
MVVKKLRYVFILVLSFPIICGACPEKVCKILRDRGYGIYLQPITNIFKIGNIRFGNTYYNIYYYDHLRISRNPIASRGTQRIIILRNNRIFVGSYDASEVTRCRVNGTRVICDVSKNAKGEIPFSKNGPPKEVFFGGSFSPLERRRPVPMSK